MPSKNDSVSLALIEICDLRCRDRGDVKKVPLASLIFPDRFAYSILFAVAHKTWRALMFRRRSHPVTGFDDWSGEKMLYSPETTSC